ncbi:recombinase family protein [Rhodospirillales bacterium]|nr:recombinase family protein [Rhodospirillales bacterium]
MKTAVAYFRTSSATNVGDDKDSQKRQREAVNAHAKVNGFKLVKEFYDAAVSGSDPIDQRDGFVEMLNYLRGNGARIILVENASRFARDLVVQITGHELLKAEGFELIPVDAPDYFIDETPTATMVRNILGAVSQFEKASVVEKLRKARERKRKETGKCEGRKSLNESRPDMVREAKRLARRNPKTGKSRSLRTISAELAALGFTRDNEQPYSAMTIRNVLNR